MGGHPLPAALQRPSFGSLPDLRGGPGFLFPARHPQCRRRHRRPPRGAGPAGLRDPRRGRARRPSGRLPGPRPRPGARRRHQDAFRRGGCQRFGPHPFPGRGPGPVAPAPSQHRADPRCQRIPGHALVRPGIHGSRQPGPQPGQLRPPSPLRRRADGAAVRGHPGRPRRRNPASGREARQRPARHAQRRRPFARGPTARRAQAHRFRHRQAARRGQPPHAHRGGHGNPRLHGPRAGRGQDAPGHPRRGHLFPRGRPLRMPHRPATLPGRDRAGDPRPGAPGRPAPARPPRARPAHGPGHGLPQSDGPRPARPLSLGPGHGRRPVALAG